MPDLVPIGMMSVTDTHNAYGFQDQPGFQGTDRISDFGFSCCYERDYLSFDPIARCTYPESIFVPHHNLRSKYDRIGWVTSPIGPGQLPVLEPVIYSDEQVRAGLPNYPIIRWDLVTRSVQTDLASVIFGPLEYTGMRAQLTPGKEHDPEGLSFGVNCTELPEGTCGFYCFKRMSAGNDAPDAYRSLKFDFFVSDNLLWRVDYNAGSGLRLFEIANDQVRQLAAINSTASYAEVVGQERYAKGEKGRWIPLVNVDQTALIVLLLNGLIQIWVHGQSQPLVIRCKDHDHFSRVRVLGEGGRYAFFSVHPMCFAANGYLISNEHQVGFVRRSSTPITYKVQKVSSPDGCDAIASTEWEQGSEFRYKLQFSAPTEKSYKGVPYSYKAASVKGVTFRIAPYVLRRLDRTAEYPMRSAQITIAFDLQNFNIYSQATVVVNNREGQWRGGWPYDGGMGNRAVSLDLGWRDIKTGGWTANRRFTGIGGLDMSYSRGPAPESTVAITCEDLSIICRDYELELCPIMDGWCHLYALRFLGWLAGLTDERMPFEYCPDPWCSNPNHYHLPLGEGGKFLMRFDEGTSAWAAMNHIRLLTQHVLFFDAWGHLQYYPWVRTSPGPLKRVFYDAPAPGLDPLQAIEQVGFTRSTRSVRTALDIIGCEEYGPTWKPIAKHRLCNDALYNKFAANYKGYRSSCVRSDPMFATDEYADQVADNLAAVVFLPGETLRLSMLAMSDLFPLDVIGLYDMEMPTNLGALAKAFFITQTVEQFEAGKTQMDYRMTVDGRWIV